MSKRYTGKQQHIVVTSSSSITIPASRFPISKRRLIEKYYSKAREFVIERIVYSKRNLGNFKETLPRFVLLLLLSAILFSLSIQIPTITNEEKAVNNFDFNFKVSQYPESKNESLPYISAHSYLVVDGDSAVVLAGKNEDEKLYPASLTKLMTTLVSLDYYNLDDIFTVKRLIKQKDESDMGLEVGDTLSVRNLIYGLLIPSGNDAAYALADNFPGGIENFIYAMNKMAKELRMENTHFTNPSGLDSLNNYSSARDLLLLAREAMKDGEIRHIVAIKQVVLPNSQGTKNYFLKNVNKLLGEISGLEGVKTGNTDLAGQCLVTSTTRNGHTIFTVVLKSDDRFLDSVKLIEWAYRNTTWKRIEI